MAYLPREQRRAAILAATLHLIRTEGFAAVTARSVAAQVGGSPGLIHQHFPSMDELVAAAWQHYVDVNIAEFSEHLAGGAEASEEFFANHSDPARREELELWVDAWTEALRRPAFAATFSSTLHQLTSALTEHDPNISITEAQHSVLLGLALASMQRLDPVNYPAELALTFAARIGHDPRG